jgi:hypothetical protein
LQRAALLIAHRLSSARGTHCRGSTLIRVLKSLAKLEGANEDQAAGIRILAP